MQIDNSGTSSLRSLHHLSNPNTPVSPHTSILSQSGYAASPNTNFPLGSPPAHSIPPASQSSNQIVASPSMPAASPANMFGVNSPINPLHAPSPSFLPTPSPSAPQSHMQSPASYMGAGSHDPSSVSSPFQPPGPNTSLPLSSPASGPWPGSPSIPRPSPRSFNSAQSPAGTGVGASPQPSQHLQALQQSHSFPSARLLPQRSWAAAIPTLLTPQGTLKVQ